MHQFWRRLISSSTYLWEVPLFSSLSAPRHAYQRRPPFEAVRLRSCHHHHPRSMLTSICLLTYYSVLYFSTLCKYIHLTLGWVENYSYSLVCTKCACCYIFSPPLPSFLAGCNSFSFMYFGDFSVFLLVCLLDCLVSCTLPAQPHKIIRHLLIPILGI